MMSPPTVIAFEELHEVHPAPWRIKADPDCPGQAECQDADGDCVMSFDEEDVQFWCALANLVNAAAEEATR